MNEHPSLGTPPAGSIRFNTDSSKMEIYNGEAWWEIDATSPEQQTGGTRGLYAGGQSNNDTIDFVNIDTTGNATDFGNLISSREGVVGSGDRTRGVFFAGAFAQKVIPLVLEEPEAVRPPVAIVSPKSSAFPIVDTLKYDISP